MNKFLLNLLKKKFTPEIASVLDYIQEETQKITEAVPGEKQNDNLSSRLFFEVSVYSLFAASYSALVRFRDKHPGIPEEFLKSFQEEFIREISSRCPGIKDMSEKIEVRRFFYRRLTDDFPKHHVFVANSTGFVMDMLRDENTPFSVIKTIIGPSEKLMLLLFLRYLDAFKKILVMGRDNRFILS